MFHETFESINGQTKEDALKILESMYLKNESVLTLIEKFQLTWACPPLDEKLNTDEIIEHLKQFKKQNQMEKAKPTPEQQMKNAVNNSNNAGKKFQTEIPDTIPNYVKFENEGDKIEGKLIGFKMLPGMNKTEKEKRFIIIDNDDNEQKILPYNLQLVNKLTFVESTVGGPLSERNFKEVQIIFNGKIPHPSKPDQQIAQFAVNV